MERLKRKWSRTPAPLRKPIVLALGCIIIVVGIILLPLPGPGWAIIFVGFAVLATEFKQAERVRDFFIRIFNAVSTYCRKVWHNFYSRIQRKR